MFLDSNDFFDPAACEKAVEAMADGYDMVLFNANIINSSPTDEKRAQGCLAACNRGAAKNYSGCEKK